MKEILPCEFEGRHEAHPFVKYQLDEIGVEYTEYLCPGVGSVRRIVERVQPNEEML